MSQLPPQLDRLGDALERAAAADLARPVPLARRRPVRSKRRGLLVAAVVLAIAVPGGAIAASQLLSTDEVAASLPAGTLSLAGTDPTCTVVTANVEYRCTLARAPAREVSDWRGTVEATVDASKHVNGGCRSLASDGKTWECYLGQKAVDQEIISEGFLGAYAPSPGVG